MTYEDLFNKELPHEVWLVEHVQYIQEEISKCNVYFDSEAFIQAHKKLASPDVLKNIIVDAYANNNYDTGEFENQIARMLNIPMSEVLSYRTERWHWEMNLPQSETWRSIGSFDEKWENYIKTVTPEQRIEDQKRYIGFTKSRTEPAQKHTAYNFLHKHAAPKPDHDKPDFISPGMTEETFESKADLCDGRYAQLMLINVHASDVLSAINNNEKCALYAEDIANGQEHYENGVYYVTFTIFEVRPDDAVTDFTRALGCTGYADASCDCGALFAAARNGEAYSDYSVRWDEGMPMTRDDADGYCDAFLTIVDPDTGIEFPTGEGCISFEEAEGWAKQVGLGFDPKSWAEQAGLESDPELISLNDDPEI